MGHGERQPVTPLGRGMVAALRVAMARRAVDQSTLAAAAGMSAPYLSRRLNAQHVLTLHDVEQLAVALGMTPEQLIREAVAESEMLGASRPSPSAVSICRTGEHMPTGPCGVAQVSR